MFKLGKFGKKEKSKCEILTILPNDCVAKNGKKLILDNTRWEASLKFKYISLIFYMKFDFFMFNN